MAMKEQQAQQAQAQAANAAAPLMTTQEEMDANAKNGGQSPQGGQAGAPGGGSVVAPSSIPNPVRTMLGSNQGANSKALKSMK